MDRTSRSSRIVQLALEKARLIHEAYAEYDAKGETPVLSTVLDNVKEKLDQSAGQKPYMEPSQCSMALFQANDEMLEPTTTALLLNQNSEQECDEDLVPSPEFGSCSSSESSDEELPLKILLERLSKEAVIKSTLEASSSNDFETQRLTIIEEKELLEDPFAQNAQNNEEAAVLIAEILITNHASEGNVSLSTDDKADQEEEPSDVMNNNEAQTQGDEPIRKKMRLTTSAIRKEIREKKKHPMIEPSCPRKCRNKNCSERTEEDRNVIWNEFWKLSYAMRRQWLCRNVRIFQVKRRTVQSKNADQNLPEDVPESDDVASKNSSNFLKNESREYFLPKPTLDCKQVRVCKKMLLNTLGFTNDSVLTELSRASKKTTIGEALGENRGRSAPANKLDRDMITNHIESFSPSISHYRRYNAPNCRYLSRDLTVQIMYKDFIAKNPGFCKVEIYRSTLKAMNISLKMPTGDRCAECLSYESAVDDAKRMDKPLDPTTASKKEQHELKAGRAKTLYNHDKNRQQAPNERIYSMDLQKVILLPIMPHIKDSFFVSRLVVYNETFAVLNSPSPYKSVAVVWHEALQGRNADSIVDTINSVMSMEHEATAFTFWADNCTSQNKNWIIYSSLVHIVNQPTGPQEVIMRYLTKGHTHMSADSVHGNIEKAMRSAGTIDNFDELIRIIQKSRKNLLVERQEIFRQWKSKKRILQKKSETINAEEEPVVLLHDIVEAKFMKGKRELFYKTDFGEDNYTQLDFLQKKFVASKPLPSLKETYRGINAEKKAKICRELVPQIKNINHHAFWLNLSESDQSRDLLNVVE